MFKGLTRQDTEYFDFNPAGALQERLNNDATALGSNLLSMPMQIIVHACASCTILKQSALTRV